MISHTIWSYVWSYDRQSVAILAQVRNIDDQAKPSGSDLYSGTVCDCQFYLEQWFEQQWFGQTPCGEEPLASPWEEG